MAENFKYTLDFRTQADTAGARKTAAAVDDVRDSTQRLQTATAGQVQQTQSLTAGQTKLAPKTRDSSQALLLFSQGLEDSQFGIRGVLNNIPGLIISLGGSAGLAGAISIAAVTLSVLAEQTGLFKKKAEEIPDRVGEISSAMREIKKEDMDGAIEGIVAAQEAAALLKQEFTETQKAQAEAAAAILTDAEKIRAAQQLVDDVLGKQVDKYAQIKAAAEAEAAARKLTADQAVQEEQARLKKAEDAATAKADLLAELQNRTNLFKAERVAEAAKLQALLDQKKVLEEIVAKSSKLQLLPDGRVLGQNELKGFLEQGTPIPKGVGAQGAVLNDVNTALTRVNNEVGGRQGVVEEIDAKIKELVTPVVGTLSRAAVQLEAANNQVADVRGAVETAISRIETTAAADDLLARAQAAATNSQQFATDIGAAVANVQTTNAQGVAAKDALLTAAADGKITAEESLSVAQNLRTLTGQLQAGIATTNGNVQQLIQIIAGLQETQRNQAAQILTLSKRP